MSEAFERDNFLLAYLKWHYGKGLKEFFAVTANFLWFITHFFSFKLLLSTLLVPWRRLGEDYGSIFHLEQFASALVTNTLMRAVGLISKVLVLSIGLVAYFTIFVLTPFFFLIWVLAPFVIVGSLILSITFFAI